MTQHQKGGNNSQNLQVENLNIQHGLTVSEVKEIANLVFDARLVEATESAKITIENRVNEFKEEFFKRLSNDETAILNSFQEPFVQDALHNAQKSYSISGDENVRIMLAEALINISKTPQNTVTGKAMAEAVKIIPSFTENQIKLICVISMMVMGPVYQVENANILDALYAGLFKGIEFSAIPTRGDFLHLNSTKAVSLLEYKIDLTQELSGRYPNLIVQLEKDKHREFWESSGRTIKQLLTLYDMPEIARLYPTSISSVISYIYLKNNGALLPPIEKLLDG